MQLQKPTLCLLTLCSLLMAGLFVIFPSTATAQDASPTADPTTPDIVRGRPFSAIRYVRKVRILPDGKQQFLRNERYPFQIARDSEGRIRMESIEPQSECDRPELLKPPPCPSWGVFLFDPSQRIITHWPEGEIAAHSSIVLKLSDQQVEFAESSTTVLPIYSPPSNWDGASFTTKDLGEKEIEGIRATGVRTTKEIPAGHLGNKDPIVTIHEVWTAADMKLIVEVIDGDPQGEETITSLEHVSLSPDPALFQSPDGYRIQHPDTVGKYVDWDMEKIAEWFPAQATTTPQQ